MKPRGTRSAQAAKGAHPPRTGSARTSRAAALAACLIPCWALARPALGAGASGVPRVDQPAYARRLRSARPDLWKLVAACKDNLILKPAYRDRVLAGCDDFESILKREYTADERAADERWADRQRAMADRVRKDVERRLRSKGLDPAKGSDPRLADAKAALPYYVVDYPSDSFIGYGIGRQKGYNWVAFDEEGLQYKVYFEFKSAVDDLTPDAYLGFTRALSAAGYRGDSKIQLRPGTARFKFNNIVAHAASKADASVAERVGLGYFKEKLASHGRGVDVAVGDDDFLDWSQFLCVGDSSRLSKAALDFIDGEGDR